MQMYVQFGMSLRYGEKNTFENAGSLSFYAAAMKLSWTFLHLVKWQSLARDGKGQESSSTFKKPNSGRFRDL